MQLDFPITFTKMSGAGNDFIVIDHRAGFIPEPYQPQFAQLVCRHSFSVGADGLILLERSETEDFSWRFYNKDGSIAEMCGNGARCAARYAWRNDITGRRMRFSTVAGVIEAEIIGEQEHVRVTMTPPSDFQDSLLIPLGESEKEIFFINTGVPHVVVMGDSVENVDVCGLGREIRHHKNYAPAGTNVNFICRQNPGQLAIRTYERGVEDETLACGTGSIASALVASRITDWTSPISLVTRSQESLTIYFREDNGRFTDVYLEGDARLIYTGELGEDAWRK